MTIEFWDADDKSAEDPQSVSRGSKLQIGFLGLDSLYLVLEYPYRDIFDYWSVDIADFSNPALNEGVSMHDMVIRRGGLGYKLSVWDGDARLFITDRVEQQLEGTGMEGQGMGLMLQLGPKWLREYGDILAAKSLKENVITQLAIFGVINPEEYKARLNRVDLTIDILGLDIAGFSVEEWADNWVGYATKKDFHFSAQTGELEGLSIGSSQGSVRFKVYDKDAESIKRGTSRFWRSVWGVDEFQKIDVARFEWSIKCYHAKFSNMRYLSDVTYERFLELLNYASLEWGRLCIPQPDDSNQSRWPLDPLWVELRRLIGDWTFDFERAAHREYDFSLDLKTSYLRSISGWIAGLQVRVGLDKFKDGPASLPEALAYLHELGYSMTDMELKANKRWRVLSKLAGQG